MISAHNLTKLFGRTPALKAVDLEVAPGETVALLGANGAGKTTLLRLLATLDKPTAGQLRIAGLDALREPLRIRAQLGLVAHQTYLHAELTVAEELRFYGRLYGLGALESLLPAQLEMVGLLPQRGLRVGALSRGQQQRLSIARALLHRPRVLLLDEPDTGLDAEGVALLERVLRSPDTTTVFSSHNRSWATAQADRVVTLQSGRLSNG